MVNSLKVRGEGLSSWIWAQTLGFQACLVAQMVKNLPAMRETRVRSPGGGHGSPLQYSCLENPMDRGTRRATVQGVAESQTDSEQAFTLTWALRVHVWYLPAELGT